MTQGQPCRNGARLQDVMFGAYRHVAVASSMALLMACHSTLAEDFDQVSATTGSDGGSSDVTDDTAETDAQPSPGCSGATDCDGGSGGLCPADSLKEEPGVCGCNFEDADSDDDGSLDCEDECPSDPDKTEAGACGCGEPDADGDDDGTPDCDDECPDDPDKTERGGCGCGRPDEDSDEDGTLDCDDACPDDPNKTEAGVCGCKVADTDEDADDVPDCIDECVGQDTNTDPSLCGCSATNEDRDEDGVADCADECPDDPKKVNPWLCDCGTPETDTDADSTPDCLDECPDDPDKTEPGLCGCGQPDADADGDGTCDPDDECPNDPDKTAPGLCGCGNLDQDTDSDGTCNDADECPDDPDKTEAGLCGCGQAELDSDGDGTCDPDDGCPDDPDKSDPGICGCDVPESDDTDSDGTLDCVDQCVDDPLKQAVGACGCGNPDTLGSNDVAECENLTNNLIHRYEFNGSGSTVTDSYGTADGTLVGGTLPNNGTAALSAGVYVDLPNNVISALTSTTIETWSTRTADGTWTRLFDFGSNDGGSEGQQGIGTSSLFYTLQIGLESRVGFRPLGGSEIMAKVGTEAPLNVIEHVVVVADAAGDEIRVYRNGAFAGTLAWTGALSEINAVNNWIGHSQYATDTDFVGLVHEFRIYSKALNAGTIQYSYDAGRNASFL